MFTDQFQKFQLPNLDLIRLPEIILTSEELSLLDKKIQNNTDFFKKLVNKGWIEFRDKVDKEKWPEYIKRIREETAIIDDLGFIDYILLIWRSVNKAKSFGAFIDFGRGSVGNSMVCRLLNIHGVDSVAKNLIFSRFLSSTRSKKTIKNGITYIQGSLAPDVDINFAPSIRDKIVEWIKELYPSRVCKISTFSTYSGKILLKECLKAIDEVSEDEAKDAADLINKHFGIVEDIGDALENNEDFKAYAENHPKVIRVCLKLRDLIKSKSSHASGYFLSYNLLDDTAPVELNKEGDLILSFDKEIASEVGIKVDYLGLTACEQVGSILKAINKDRDDFNLENDGEIYQRFQDGKLLPYGLYQISADCAYGVCQSIKPVNIDEISDVNAIARPGALSYLKQYTDHSASCPHPLFEDILKPTRNLCLFQEQMIRLLMAVGFSAEESETCRKIVGKKLVEKVKDWKQKIYDKVKENNFDIKIGDILWKILEDSAFYSFNAGHSYGVSYLGALTVLLKYKYPLQFYVSCLQLSSEYPEPMKEIADIQKELPHFGIKLLGPDLLKSQLAFSIEDGSNIRYGLSSVKGVSSATLEKLINFRKEYPSKIEMFHSAKESGLNIGVLSALIQAGAMSDYESKGRSKLVLEAQTYNLLTDREKLLIQQLYNNKIADDILVLIKKCVEELKDEKGKPLIKESRFETIKKKYQKFKEIYQLNSRNEELASYFYELNCIGFSYSQKLAEIYKKSNPDIKSLAEVIKCDEKENVLFVGIVQEVINRKSKKSNNPYLKITLGDEEAKLECFLFVSNYGDKIQECRDNNNGKLPVAGDVLVVTGSKKGKDAVYADCIGIQTQKVFTALRQLAKNKEENPDQIIS